MDVVTSAERPDLEDEAGAAFKVKWPEFIFHDPIAKQYVAQVAECFPQYDVLLLDEGRVVAGGWGVPIRWDGTVEDLPDGYDGAMARAVEGHQSGVQATTFSFMAVAVGNGETKRGLAGEVMTALRLRAAQAGLAHVIAPLRPTLKPKYPLVPMASFAAWTRPDGLSIDPWIRAHQRMGSCGPGSGQLPEHEERTHPGLRRGIFGPLTRAWVIHFQQDMVTILFDKSFPVDGIVGPLTWPPLVGGASELY